jgi:ribosomal protein S12 methylthiotransferase
MRQQNAISRKARKAMVGRSFDLLVEGPSEETPLLWEGRTHHQAPEIDGKVYINDFGPFEELDRGQFYRCEITESQDYDLVGRIIS